MNTFKMQNNYDCGPAAIAFITGADIEDVKKDWPIQWPDSNSFWDNLFDFPGMHFIYLDSKKLNFTVSKYVQPYSVVLLHWGSNPYQRLTSKHWAVYLHDAGSVKLMWGNQEHPLQMKLETFSQLYTDIFPTISYKLGTPMTTNIVQVWLWKLLSYLMFPMLYIISRYFRWKRP